MGSCVKEGRTAAPSASLRDDKVLSDDFYKGLLDGMERNRR